MLKSRAAKEAKALQCRGEAHQDAPHSELPWVCRSSSPAFPQPRNCWGKINLPPKEINVLGLSLSSYTHIGNLAKRACCCKLPARTAARTSKLLYFHHPGQTMIFYIQNAGGAGSMSQTGLSEGEGLIKWLGLSLKWHNVLSSILNRKHRWTQHTNLELLFIPEFVQSTRKQKQKASCFTKARTPLAFSHCSGSVMLLLTRGRWRLVLWLKEQ